MHVEPTATHVKATAMHAKCNYHAKTAMQAGQLVIRQGDPGDHFYVVGTGLFDIYLQQSANSPPELVCGPLIKPWYIHENCMCWHMHGWLVCMRAQSCDSTCMAHSECRTSKIWNSTSCFAICCYPTLPPSHSPTLSLTLLIPFYPLTLSLLPTTLRSIHMGCQWKLSQETPIPCLRCMTHLGSWHCCTASPG